MSTHQQQPTSDPKAMARRLRQTLADRGVEVSHSEALELVAQQHGARDWNTLAAGVSTSSTGATDNSAFGPVIPVLRIFDVAKAREFYGGSSASPSTGSTPSTTTRRSICRPAATAPCST